MISGENMEPTEIETLLPWYAAGTLRRRDRQRVEDALRYDPAAARHPDLERGEPASPPAPGARGSATRRAPSPANSPPSLPASRRARSPLRHPSPWRRSP